MLCSKFIVKGVPTNTPLSATTVVPSVVIFILVTFGLKPAFPTSIILNFDSSIVNSYPSTSII